MAGLKNADDFKDGEQFKGAGFIGVLALIIGAVATLAFFGIALFVPSDGDGYTRQDGMAFSWLFAVMFFLSLAVGGMFWTLLHHATNSGWGTVVRRLMENIGILIPVVLFLSLPLLLPQVGFRDVLWEWLPERKAAEAKAAVAAEEGKAEYFGKVRSKAKKASAEVASLEKEKVRLRI